MLTLKKSDLEIPATSTPVAKLRRCLMCGTDFRSSHVGERICSKCRQSKVWRDGETFHRH